MIGINRLLWNWHRQRLPVRARTLLFLEHLETRALPASVFVVPTAAPLDAAHFHTLSDACTAAGAGGTVTVEPGSGDSNTVENVSITEPGITVQGVSYENTPGGYFDVTVRAESVSIINLKVSVTFGSGFGHTTIKRCETGVLTQLASPAGNGADVITQNTIRGTLLL